MARKRFFHFSLVTSFNIFLLFLLAQFSYAASFRLSPATGEYAVGETFSVVVILDTSGGKTSGSDIYFTFDINTLELTDIINGTVYDQYVGKSVDNTSGKGSLSGIVASRERLFSGRGIFATLRLRGLQAGRGRIQFAFSPGNANDSNVADFEKQKDILTSVVNGFYTVTGGGRAPTRAPATTEVLEPTTAPIPTVPAGSTATKGRYFLPPFFIVILVVIFILGLVVRYFFFLKG